MLTEYQQRLREKYLSAPLTGPPEPWQASGATGSYVSVGGLQGVGFGVHPETGDDLLMVVSTDGFGLLDATTGAKIARDRDPDPEVATPDGPDLACPGIGALTGTRVMIAGLFGGGLHTTTADGWSIDVVAPEWPHQRVMLSAGGGLNAGEPGTSWWHIFDDPGKHSQVPTGHDTSGSRRRTATDMVMGAVAGAAGVWVMDRIGWLLYRHEDPSALAQEHDARPGGRDVAHAMVAKVGQMTGIQVPTEQPNAAGLAVHYALGVVPAALYATGPDPGSWTR